MSAANALHGVATRTRVWPGLTLTETCYPAGLRLALHSHTNSYLCFVLQGGFTEYRAGRSRECRSRTLVLHPIHEAHANRFHAASRCFNVILTEPWIERAAAPHLREPAIVDAGPVSALATRLYREFREPDEASRLIVEGLTLEIIGTSGRRRNRGRARRAPRWMTRALELLHDRYRERFSLAELARDLGVHETHLAREFRRRHQCTAGEYVRQLRVAYAREQLASTARPISAIAAEAGFCDQSHFTRCFTQLAGTPPARYRRLHQR